MSQGFSSLHSRTRRSRTTGMARGYAKAPDLRPGPLTIEQSGISSPATANCPYVPIDVLMDGPAVTTIAIVIGVAAIAVAVVAVTVIAVSVAVARTNANTDADRARAYVHALRARWH
jgi:hypothetical protein